MDTDQDQEEVNVDEAEAKVIDLEQDEDVLAIERACEGRCRLPNWVFYRPLESDVAVQWGAALRVDLHVSQYHATDQIYATQKEAKSACARLAISEGVLKAIGDLQQSSSQSPSSTQEPSDPISLHEWFDKLPRPLPPFFDDKVLTEIHGAVTLDSWAGKARGARFKMYYYFPTFGQEPHRLFGCVLRIVRPRECRSFFVDPVFSKRFDAKTAVCLLAISRGVEDYYSSVANEIANIITPELRAFTSEQILPLLNQIAPGDPCSYSYSMDRNAFGCTLTVGIGAEEIEYSAEPEFSSKADAKIAVLLIASTNGLVKFVNYGHTPPGFEAHWAAIEPRVSSMPIAFKDPTKRKRDRPQPRPIPVMKESKKLKKQRKQAQAAAKKKSEAAACLIKDAISRTSQPSNGTPSEKALSKRPAISRPLHSNTSFEYPGHSQPVQVPHFQGRAAWPTSMWDNLNTNPNSMQLQSYPNYSYLSPQRTQYGYHPGYMDLSYQQSQYEYSDDYHRGNRAWPSTVQSPIKIPSVMTPTEETPRIMGRE
ncbi:hypothetical protein C0989_011283 [Termitomyces sp. Mn162]|nr:hypothetical protein C0989_011283 [Termitomyces sp. Mn162]